MAKEEQKPDTPFTAEEAAEALRVHPKTLKRWLAEGKLKGVRLGRAWRIPRSEITRLLNSD